jgi:hypothetical protein
LIRICAPIRLGTPATVPCDGDAGLCKLQRQVMPEATLVLDWWHIATRLEHALEAARGLGAGAASAHLGSHSVRDLENAKWKLWHGRSSSCLGRLAKLANWFDSVHVRDVRGVVAAPRHISDLIEYLHANTPGRVAVFIGKRKLRGTGLFGSERETHAESRH